MNGRTHTKLVFLATLRPLATTDVMVGVVNTMNTVNSVNILNLPYIFRTVTVGTINLSEIFSALKKEENAMQLTEK